MSFVTTPRSVQRWAVRVLLVSAPVTAFIMGGWALGHWATRPNLAMMVYLLALGVTMMAALACVLALCHVQLAQAFSAGVRVGQAYTAAQPAPVAVGRPDLQVVE